MERDNQELYREIARRYADAFGREILSEQPHAQPTPDLDWRVRRELHRRRMRLVTRVAATLAACLVLAILVPQILRTTGDQFSPVESDEPAADGAATPEEPAEDAEGPEEIPPSAAEEPAAVEPLPIHFSLPSNLSVSAVDQDRGQTIYYLEDQWRDDVVMMLERADTGAVPDGLAELVINDRTAWGVSTADYQLLSFQEDGIVYTLTCRHDINTLVDLGRNIL